MEVAKCARRWPDPVAGPYVVSVSFTVEDGEIGLRWAGVAGVGDRTVPTRLLSRLPWARIVAAMLDELRDRWAPLVERYQPDVAAGLRSAPARRGRPPLYDDDHWQEVADVYRANPKGPVVAVTERWRVSYSAARHWVERCRAKRLL